MFGASSVFGGQHCVEMLIESGGLCFGGGYRCCGGLRQKRAFRLEILCANLAFAPGLRKTKENVDRFGWSQELADAYCLSASSSAFKYWYSASQPVSQSVSQSVILVSHSCQSVTY